MDGVATVTAEDTTLRYRAWEQQISVLTLGEVGPRGRDGDSDWQRTTIVLGEVKGTGEGAGDESANGKDRRESDHRGGMGISGGRGRGVRQGENGESHCQTQPAFILALRIQKSQDRQRSNVGNPETSWNVHHMDRMGATRKNRR